MPSTLRPKGTVEVTCQHPGCGWSWWVDPLDQRLPDGPWDCGQDHEAERAVRRAFTQVRLQTGIHCGTMVGRGPNRPDLVCEGRKSYRAGIAGVRDRLRAKEGFFEWSSLDELLTVEDIVKRIQWGQFLLPGGSVGPTRDPFEAKPGYVQTVGYRWRGAEVREYTFVKCARHGCPHHIMVDYERPSMNCCGGASYEVGSWGGSERPTPRWWGSREFYCGEGLSTFAPYPCSIVHGSDVLSELERTGMIWTMWAPPVLEGGAGHVLFYDQNAGAHGLLSYTSFPGGEMPMEFSSLSTLRRLIYWGALRSIAAMVRDSNEISFELQPYVEG